MEAINSQRVPRRARTIINRLLGSRTITGEGLQWLIAVTDPFHDTELRVCGYPDVSSARSVNQTLTKTYTISTPTPATEAEWDCHVFFNPVTPSFVTTDEGGFDPVYHRAALEPSGQVIPNIPPTGLGLYSGVNVITTAPGTGYQNATTGFSYSNLTIPGQFCVDNWRLLAVGFEVVNTTAMLYKGGSVTSYRCPSRAAPSLVWFVPDAGEISYSPASVTTLPPNLQADAAVFPDSTTWGAEDGVYVVGTLNTVQNSYNTIVPGCAVMATPPSYDNVLDSDQRLAYVPLYDPDNASSPASSLSTSLPWDISGSIFTGLNSKTTLQVTARYYFERVPTTANQDLLVLSKPPCSWDPTVLEIVSRVMQEAPVACKVAENPLGEWFADVLDAVGKYAPTIGRALGDVGIPFAGQIGSILGAGASGAVKLVRKSNAPTNQKGKEAVLVSVPKVRAPKPKVVVSAARKIRIPDLREQAILAKDIARDADTLRRVQRIAGVQPRRRRRGRRR